MTVAASWTGTDISDSSVPRSGKLRPPPFPLVIRDLSEEHVRNVNGVSRCSTDSASPMSDGHAVSDVFIESSIRADASGMNGAEITA